MAAALVAVVSKVASVVVEGATTKQTTLINGADDVKATNPTRTSKKMQIVGSGSAEPSARMVTKRMWIGANVAMRTNAVKSAAKMAVTDLVGVGAVERWAAVGTTQAALGEILLAASLSK